MPQHPMWRYHDTQVMREVMEDCHIGLNVLVGRSIAFVKNPSFESTSRLLKYASGLTISKSSLDSSAELESIVYLEYLSRSTVEKQRRLYVMWV